LLAGRATAKPKAAAKPAPTAPKPDHAPRPATREPAFEAS
jgi:hypothetical protein